MDLKRCAANAALVKGVNANDQSNGRRNQRLPHILHPISERFELYTSETELRRVQFAGFKKILMNQIASSLGDIET
jgi:hypothetical protein